MQASLQSIIEALPDGAIVVDPGGAIAFINGLASDIVQTDAIGIPVTSIIRSSSFASAIAEVRNSRRPATVAIEMRVRPARSVSAHIAPLGPDGGALVVLRDLTHEQAVEKMRSDFVANASHEMRTPLASIIGIVETLQGAARNDDKARETFLVTMLEQARRMKRLIDDLLTLSRIELNEHVRPSARVSLFDVTRQARNNLEGLAKELAVTVELHGETDVVVAGDADQLLQVAQNLLENAIKYGGSGGRVELHLAVEGKYGALAVRDFGKGIAEIHIPRLTERFYRVSTQESRARGGTGLGLAIAKHIVQRHRGKLDIESESGQGSTFKISIPLFSSKTYPVMKP